MKNKIKLSLTFAAILLLMILGAVGYAYYRRLEPSKDRASLYEYLDISNADELAICHNGQYVGATAYKDGDVVYLPLDFVKENINGRYYYNGDEDILLYSLEDKTLSLSYRLHEDTAYISAEDVGKYSAVAAVASDAHTLGIYTDDFVSEARTASVKADTQLREKGGIKSPILFDIAAGTPVFVVEEMEKWARVAGADGRCGYMKKTKLVVDSEKTAKEMMKLLDINEIAKDDFKNQVREHKISMGWHLMMSKAGNSEIENIAKASPGMNVISPTWFSVKDNDGNIESFAEKSYVDRAHALGLEVWGLINDINHKEAKAKIFLHSTEVRGKIIEALIEEALRVGMDGINLDFESIPKDTGEDFIQFVRELSIECRKNELVLSVDNYVPRDFNRFFNRREQGIFADYVVIMGYDEHYSGSKEAGSVASIGFVKNGIEETLREVDKSRVINGLPAYMRVWTHTDTGLKARSISMHQAAALIEEYSLEPIWDEGVGQYYAEYTNKDGNYCQIWIEDLKSVDKKMDVIIEKDIAGLALWRLGLETEDVWQSLGRLNK